MYKICTCVYMYMCKKRKKKYYTMCSLSLVLQTDSIRLFNIAIKYAINNKNFFSKQLHHLPCSVRNREWVCSRISTLSFDSSTLARAGEQNSKPMTLKSASVRQDCRSIRDTISISKTAKIMCIKVLCSWHVYVYLYIN